MRYYNITIKRFINKNVVIGHLDATSSLNRYAYCEGNPVSFLDPFGLEKSDKTEIDWILRYGDLSKLDDSFLFKENNGVYGFITETLYLRKKGLSEDYLVFQIFDNKFLAINFDDKKVYSFKAGEYEEAVSHGTFLNYLKQQLIP